MKMTVRGLAMGKFEKATIFFLSVVFLMVGCETTQKDTSVYRSPHDRGIPTTGVDPYDYQLVVEKMVSSMLKHGLETEEGERPVITLGPIYNNTPYNIEIRMIGEDIRTEVLRSGIARFSTATDYERAGGESGVLYKQLEFQSESGHVDPSTAKRYGQIVGADYILFGNIYSISRRTRQETEANFRFNLTLTEVATGIAVWAETKPIRKIIR